MNFLRQSTASQIRSLGAFVDDTDGKTPETGLTIANTDVKLIKNGAASINKNSGGGTHRINGFYGFTFDATDSATVGELEVSVKVAGALSVWKTFFVLPQPVYDLFFASAATGDVKLQGVTHTDAVIPTVTTLTNLPAITAGWLTAAGIAAGALDSKGNWNIGKTNYSLIQAFPANFASLSISVGGLVNILQTAADKVWNTTSRILTANTNFNDPTAAAIADAVHDESLEDHVAEGTAGYAQMLSVYAGPRGPGIYIASEGANTNTVPGTDGTEANPVSTFIAARTLANSIGTDTYYLETGTDLTLAATHASWRFFGLGSPSDTLINLDSQDVSLSLFDHVSLEGTQGGSGRIFAEDCVLRDPGPGSTILHILGLRCGIFDDITLDTSNDNILIDSYSLVAGGGTPIVRASGAAGTLIMNGHKGGVDLRDLSASHNLTVNIAGGQVIFDASCNVNANVELRGIGRKTDNTAGMASLNEVAFINMDKINAEADIALADYDGPTNAEMIARTLIAANYFDPAEDTVANVTLVATTTTLTNKTGFSLAATGLDAIVSTATGMIEIAKAVWDRIISKANHDIGQSAAKTLRQSGDLVQIDGAVNDVAPATTGFNTTLTQPDDYFEDAVMIFSNGSANAGIGRPVSTHLNINGAVTFDVPDDWPVTPVDGDDFVIYATHVHPVNQIANAVMAAGDIDGYTLEKSQKIILGAAAGKTSGAGTASFVVRAADDSKDRITAATDASGNRTGTVLDGEG